MVSDAEEPTVDLADQLAATGNGSRDGDLVGLDAAAAS